MIGVASLIIGLCLSALVTYANAWFHDWLTTPVTLLFFVCAMIIIPHKPPRRFYAPAPGMWPRAVAMYLGLFAVLYGLVRVEHPATLAAESAAAHQYDAASDCRQRTLGTGPSCEAHSMIVRSVYGHRCVQMSDGQQHGGTYCTVNTSWAEISPSVWHTITVGDSVEGQTLLGRPVALWLPRGAGHVVEMEGNPNVVFTRHFEECYMFFFAWLLVTLVPVAKAFDALDARRNRW